MSLKKVSSTANFQGSIQGQGFVMGGLPLSVLATGNIPADTIMVKDRDGNFGPFDGIDFNDSSSAVILLYNLNADRKRTFSGLYSGTVSRFIADSTPGFEKSKCQRIRFVGPPPSEEPTPPTPPDPEVEVYATADFEDNWM